MKARAEKRPNLGVETCIQYLILNDSMYDDPEEGLKAIMSPPLRKVADREELWEALRAAVEPPDWFGANLDALWDLLTGEEPKDAHWVLALPREDSPAYEYAARIRAVFEEAERLA